MSSQSKQTVWTSRPQEKRRVWHTSFAKFPIEENLQYQFQSTGSRLKYVELRKTDCEDLCMSMPCMNGGTCINRLKSYTCFCTAGFSGEQCQQDITCDSPATSLPFNSNVAVANTESGLLLPESTVTYKCNDRYVVSGHQSTSSFSSTCKRRASTDESVWDPPLENVRCEDYWIETALDNSVLASPEINPDYAISRSICVVFGYGLRGDSTMSLQVMSQFQPAWVSHPHEERDVWLTSFVNIPIEQNLRYQFKSTGTAGLRFITAKRTDCEDWCMTEPCMNRGTCVNRPKSYTCFCRPGFGGKQCQFDDLCMSEPCMNGGTCINRWTSYTCRCPWGRFGKKCQF